MEFSNSVKTTVNSKLVPKVIDTVLNFSPVTLRILGNQKTWSGASMKFPIKYEKSNQGKSFDGMDRFNTAEVDNRINMEFTPTGRTMPVVLSQMEIDVNATDEQVLNLLKLSMASSAQDMADDIADIFLGYKDSGSKDFLGIYDAADDGTNTGTYGGLARATYSGIKGNLTSSSGSLTAEKMRAMMDKCIHGNDKPTYIVTTKTLWAAYEKLVSEKVSANYAINGYPQLTRTGVAAGVQALRGQLGFDAIWFAGTPVVADEKIDDGYMAFVNEKHLAFYGLKSKKEGYTPISFTSNDIEGVYSDVPSTTGFAWSGLMSPIDQYGVIGHIILMGNLISDSPRHLGLLTGLTA